MQTKLRINIGRQICIFTDLRVKFNFKGSDSEGKKSKKLNPSMQSSDNKLAENIEIASSMKRQVIETSTGSQKSSSPTKTGMLSRESSFKSMDKGKTKPANQLFYANLSNNDILETARSPRTGPQLQTPKGKHTDNVYQTFRFLSYNLCVLGCVVH